MSSRSDPETRQASLLLSGLVLTPDDALGVFRERRAADVALDLEHLKRARDILDYLSRAITSSSAEPWERIEQAWNLLHAESPTAPASQPASEPEALPAAPSPPPLAGEPEPPSSPGAPPSPGPVAPSGAAPSPAAPPAPPPIRAPGAAPRPPAAGDGSPWARGLRTDDGSRGSGPPEAPAVIPAPSASPVPPPAVPPPRPPPAVPPPRPAAPPAPPPPVPAPGPAVKVEQLDSMAIDEDLSATLATKSGPDAALPFRGKIAAPPPSALAKADSDDDADDPLARTACIDPPAAAAHSTLPFSKPEDKEASAPRAPAKPSVAEVPPLPEHLSAMTVEQYASLCAECSVHARWVNEISARYGVRSEQDREALDAHFQARMAGDPQVAESWRYQYARVEQWAKQQQG